jgi:chromosome partitioning protein
MIVLFGGQKGGTGKSTISINVSALLASQGKDILVVDGNATQGTISNWCERRESTDLPLETYIKHWIVYEINTITLSWTPVAKIVKSSERPC